MWIARADASLPPQQLQQQSNTDLSSARLQALFSKMALRTRTTVPCWTAQVHPAHQGTHHVPKARSGRGCSDQLNLHNVQA